MSDKVFAHPFLGPLLSDAEAEALLSAGSDLTHILEFEAALAEAEGQHGVIPAPSAITIAATARSLKPDLEALALATARDGVVVPELLRQLRAALPAEEMVHVHFGATSQDAIDTSLILRLHKLLPLFEQRLSAIDETLLSLADQFGGEPLMAQTRMQDAMPASIGHRLAAWRAGMSAIGPDLEYFRTTRLCLQLGGPVGLLDALGHKAIPVRKTLATLLKVPDGNQWQNNRQVLAELAGLLVRLTGALGKLGQDIALMAQNPRQGVRLSGGGTSSAMAHKSNPVRAEILVALARYNATQLSAIHQALIHEQERSGAAWTLEWLALPQILITTGASLNNAAALLAQIDSLGEFL